MTPAELDAIEAEIVEGDESVDDLAALIAALREAWAEVERLCDDMAHQVKRHGEAIARAEAAEADAERLRRGEVDGVFTSVVHECCEQVARVRAICTRADNDEFHSPYQVAEFIRDAIEARAEACPFCTREAQAECESTGRCSEEDEIDAVLDDRPDLNPYEALVAGLRERGAEVEHWKEQHLAGDTPFLRDRAEKAEAAIARVRALCDAPAVEAGHEVERHWVSVPDLRAALDLTRPIDGGDE